MRTDGSLHFAVADAGAPPASELIEAMIAELVTMYGRIDGAGTPSATPRDFAPPGGSFLVGSIAGEPVTGGGLKRLAPGLAEIKRMYVVPAHRGRGVATELLAALENAAVDLGYSTVRLDTGPFQTHARRLYERSGYVTIPDYNANPHADYWGEKHLSVDRTGA
jgi:GNAT superfamily N-acetyltransferase